MNKTIFRRLIVVVLVIFIKIFIWHDAYATTTVISGKSVEDYFEEATLYYDSGLYEQAGALFRKATGYKNGYEWALYCDALLKVENEAIEDAQIDLRYLSSIEFQDSAQWLEYCGARISEASGLYLPAMKKYQTLNVRDSYARYCKMVEYVTNPQSIPRNAEVSITPTPLKRGVSALMTQSIQLFTGPGAEYEALKFRTDQKQSLKVLELVVAQKQQGKENWYYVEYLHDNQLFRGYGNTFRIKPETEMKKTQEVAGQQYHLPVATSALSGPGTSYASYDFELPQYVQVTVYDKEGNYLLCEAMHPVLGKLVRCWVPDDLFAN